MRFNTILKLGPNREITKEGFTLFRNVSISRTGWQVYGPNEGTGIEPGPDGLVHIFRSPEEVFRTETLDSCNGKSLVIQHPDDDVTPYNWRDLTHGFMVNARRGTGDQKDESVADVFVTTPEALAEIDSGMREVSLGYDADYFQTGPGKGEQRSLYINHVALVEAGRCGSRCAVKDHANARPDAESKEICMSKIWDAVLAALPTKDEATIKAAVLKARDAEEEAEEKKKKEEAEAKDKALDARFQTITDSLPKLVTDAVRDCMKEMQDKAAKDAEEERERKEKEEKESRDRARDDEEEAELEEEAPDEKKKDARRAKDSALLVDSFNTVKSQAEIVAPGIQFPTFDAAADPKKTFRDCICGLRRKALTLGLNDTATAAVIAQVRGRAIDQAAIATLSCRDTRSLFNGVMAVKSQMNTAAVAAPGSVRTSDVKTPMDRFKEASNTRWNTSAKK